MMTSSGKQNAIIMQGSDRSSTTMVDQCQLSKKGKHSELSGGETDGETTRTCMEKQKPNSAWCYGG